MLKLVKLFITVYHQLEYKKITYYNNSNIKAVIIKWELSSEGILNVKVKITNSKNINIIICTITHFTKGNRKKCFFFSHPVIFIKADYCTHCSLIE